MTGKRVTDRWFSLPVRDNLGAISASHPLDTAVRSVEERKFNNMPWGPGGYLAVVAEVHQGQIGAPYRVRIGLERAARQDFIPERATQKAGDGIPHDVAKDPSPYQVLRPARPITFPDGKTYGFVSVHMGPYSERRLPNGRKEAVTAAAEFLGSLDLAQLAAVDAISPHPPEAMDLTFAGGEFTVRLDAIHSDPPLTFTHVSSIALAETAVRTALAATAGLPTTGTIEPGPNLTGFHTQFRPY